MTPLDDGVYRLTNQGHDFLETIRNETVWEKTREVIAKAGGNATLDILTGVATGFLRAEFARHTGIDI